MEPFNLKQLESRFLAEQFDCSTVEGDSQGPRLMVFLGTDYRERERILEVTIRRQVLSAVVPASRDEPQPLLLEFHVALPIDVQAFATAEVARVIAYLNSQLDLPGFTFEEISGSLSFRHVLITNEQFDDWRAIQGIVGMIMLLLQLFTETIERIANGSKTANELINIAQNWKDTLDN